MISDCLTIYHIIKWTVNDFHYTSSIVNQTTLIYLQFTASPHLLITETHKQRLIEKICSWYIFVHLHNSRLSAQRRTSMAWPSSRSNVTTQTQAIQRESLSQVFFGELVTGNVAEPSSIDFIVAKALALISCPSAIPLSFTTTCLPTIFGHKQVWNFAIIILTRLIKHTHLLFWFLLVHTYKFGVNSVPCVV